MTGRRLTGALIVSGALLAAGAWALAAGRADGEDGVRFAAWDVLVDSGDRPLAAWQVEVTDPSGRARVVGVEGGEDPAWAEPPRYDPRALAGGRIVIAAFSLDEELPAGRVRVARLHLEVRGEAPPDLRARLEAAATTDGERIEATVTLRTARTGE